MQRFHLLHHDRVDSRQGYQGGSFSPYIYTQSDFNIMPHIRKLIPTVYAVYQYWCVDGGCRYINVDAADGTTIGQSID